MTPERYEGGRLAAYLTLTLQVLLIQIILHTIENPVIYWSATVVAFAWAYLEHDWKINTLYNIYELYSRPTEKKTMLKYDTNLPSVCIPKQEAGIQTPPGGWEPSTYYVVQMSMSTNNPLFLAILYTGFLSEKGNPAGYSTLFPVSTPKDNHIEFGQVHYLKPLQKLLAPAASNDEDK